MRPDPTSSIPIPFEQRWRDACHRLLPILVFGATVCMIALLWKGHVAAPTLVGQAEPVVANVSSHKPGVLAELTVGRFQRVKAGDPVDQMIDQILPLLEAGDIIIDGGNSLFTDTARRV